MKQILLPVLVLIISCSTLHSYPFFHICRKPTNRLQKCRETIDKIDDTIHQLLTRRMKISRQIKDLKSGIVEDKVREREIIDRLRERSEEGVLRPEFVQSVWEQIFLESKYIQYSS